LAPAKNNLVALGSAAVIAVYATGYARTRAAAAQFADEVRERPPVHPAKHDAVLPTAAPATPVTPAPTASKPEPSRPTSAPKKAVAKEPKKDTAVKAVAPTTVAPTTVAPTTVAPTSVAPPATNASPPVTTTPPTPPKDTAVKTATTATADTTAQSDKTVAYKDGMFTGWGTSRHGDIQATVMIKEGKIVGAVISECLTQYSCSWISMLPQQVLDRQSADVDYVSGATQSASAFYYAVLNALKKAK
jgi:uncharacterized protein with FMN-binding domain